MYVIRDIMYCKPGQVRPMVEKFRSVSKAMEQSGLRPVRILTDVSAERYWTVVAEFEAESLDQFAAESRATMSDEKVRKILQGYHDLVDGGRREIYMVEG